MSKEQLIARADVLVQQINFYNGALAEVKGLLLALDGAIDTAIAAPAVTDTPEIVVDTPAPDADTTTPEVEAPVDAIAPTTGAIGDGITDIATETPAAE